MLTDNLKKGMFIDGLKEVAKKNLSKDGHLASVFFLLRDETLIGEPLLTSMFDHVYKDNVNAEDSKTRAVFCMGALAKKFNANRLIMIWDAAMRTMPPDTKINALDTTEAPLSYPKSMRTECIIINEIFFPDGKDNTIILTRAGMGNPWSFSRKI